MVKFVTNIYTFFAQKFLYEKLTTFNSVILFNAILSVDKTLIFFTILTLLN